jgi:ribulose-bisphosphate carboxylase large chain
MSMTLQATYLIETPLDPRAVAEVLAGEQSSGTFVRVAGESDALRARSRATVDAVQELPSLAAPSLPSAWLQRHHPQGPWRRARVTVSFPTANIGHNLTALAATVAATCSTWAKPRGCGWNTCRSRRNSAPASNARATAWPARVRSPAWRPGRWWAPSSSPMSVSRRQRQRALVAELCRAGVDFIKDDECCGDPDHAPIAERISAVMAAVRKPSRRRPASR